MARPFPATRKTMRPDPLSPPGFSPHVSLQFLDDAGVLFRADTKQLYALNTTGTFIWCQLEEGLTPEEIAPLLQQSFGLDAAQAAACLQTALSQWRSLGLVRDTENAPRQPEPNPDFEVGYFRLLEMPFCLRASSAMLREQLAGLLAPLADPNPCKDAALDILVDERDRVLKIGNENAEICDDVNQIVPMIKAGLVRLALERSNDALAFHAAGVSLKGRCLLMPGASGSGKSTLTAALVGAGLPLLGDDTIVLTDDFQARPMPFAICLKTGSWALLQSRFPRLALQPTYCRMDGKYVRYLLPPDPKRWIDPSSRQPVGWIVFPSHAPQAKSRLEPLPRPEALRRLMQDCYPLGAGLDAAKVAQLVAWIREVACFELRFSALEDAVEQLCGLAARS